MQTQFVGMAVSMLIARGGFNSNKNVFNDASWVSGVRGPGVVMYGVVLWGSGVANNDLE